jgi:UDP-N-acetylmuramyl pentapeptide synthase
LHEASVAMGGRAVGGRPVRRYFYDTRTVKRRLFAVIRGDRFDGHKFLEVACSMNAPQRSWTRRLWPGRRCQSQLSMTPGSPSDVWDHGCASRRR